MVKSENSKEDKQVYHIIAREINRFSSLIRGHEKILRALGKI